MIHIGNLLVPAYGVAVAVALMCGMVLAMRCAQQLQLDSRAFWNLLVLGILSALLGTRLEYFLLHLRDVMAAPVLLLNGNGISAGGMLVMAIACYLYLRILRKRGIVLPLLTILDALAAPILLSIAILEGMAAYLLWDLLHAPAYLCAVHLVACAAIVALLEVKKKNPLRDGELVGAMLFLLALSLIGWSLAEQYELSITADLHIQAWLAVFMVLVAGALWFDWNALPRPRKKEDHAL